MKTIYPEVLDPVPPELAARVVKSNALINAMFDMTLQGVRFFAFAISLLDRTQIPETGKPVDLEIPVLEFAKAFDLDPKNAYREIEVLADQFQRKIITLQPNQTIEGIYRVKVGLISKQKYFDGEGRVWIRFDEDIVPHLLCLKEQFTEYRIKDVYQFSSVHTWRIYELLEQYKSIGKREIELDELKRKVGIAGLYERIGDLKRRILDTAVKEINAVSDIQVQYEQKKRGRRVVSFLFLIRKNEKTMTEREKIRNGLEKELDTGQDRAPEFSRLLREEYSVSPKQARQIANLANSHEAIDRLTKLLPKIKARFEKLETRTRKTGLGGYIFRALHDELMPKLPI